LIDQRKDFRQAPMTVAVGLLHVVVAMVVRMRMAVGMVVCAGATGRSPSLRTAQLLEPAAAGCGRAFSPGR
jgi:hypothetical protein